MPLSIPMPARAKLIINGAVIENSGSANITLTIHNKANILRDKDVLTQEEANTPAKEVYHAIQNAYLFEVNKDEWMGISLALLNGFGKAWPGSEAIVGHVRELMKEDKLYHALRASRRLIAFEAGEPVEPLPRGGKQQAGDDNGVEAQAEIDRMRQRIAALEQRLGSLGSE